MWHAGRVAIYFEAAAVIVVLVGLVVELRVRSCVGSAIQGMADKVAGIFVRVVLAVTVLTFGLLVWLGTERRIAQSIREYHALGLNIVMLRRRKIIILTLTII